MAGHKRLIHLCQNTSFLRGPTAWENLRIAGYRTGRILAPFTYKVYVNRLLNVLSNHCYANLTNGLRVPSPSSADDVSLLTLHPSFLKTFINTCNRYAFKSRYDFNHSKSGVVTLGETKPQHSESLKNREWPLGDTEVEERYDYKNLGVLKHYVGSFSSNIDDYIDKIRKKVGMIFLPILIIGKSIRSFILSSRGKPACPRCCMVLNFLRLLLLYC